MKVKIIASVGPSTKDLSILREMQRLGVRCFRINFAHGSPVTWSEILGLLRDLEKASGEQICTVGDIPGPSIRLGDFEGAGFRRGERVVFTAREGGGVPVRDPEFFQLVEEGDLLLMDDGRIVLEVVSSSWDRVEAIALSDGFLRPGKSVTVKGKEIPSQILRPRDLEALRFAVEGGITYVGVSNVRSAEDLRVVRKAVRGFGGDQRLLAKIETQSSVRNLDQILSEADGIVVARGDLGMNLGLENVPSVQRRIVRVCLRSGKPVVIATQLLESMVSSPVPTRAEVSDLYTAVIQGADAVMLTGETAVGSYPVEVVRWARRIIERAEKDLEESPEIFERPAGYEIEKHLLGVLRLSESIEAPMITVDSSSEAVARLSSLKPKQPLVFITGSSRAYREAQIFWGVETIYSGDRAPEDLVGWGAEEAMERGILSSEKASTVVALVREGGRIVVRLLEPQPTRLSRGAAYTPQPPTG